MTFGIIVPTLWRASRLERLVANIEEATELEHRTYLVVDPDDTDTHRTVAMIIAGGALTVAMIVEGGTYPHKTNAGVHYATEDALVLTADDVVFRPGWDLIAAEALGDPGVDVVGTNDLSPSTAEGAHATMPIVRRSYIEELGAAAGPPGVAFHEGYHHNFVETELWQLALARGVAEFRSDCVIEHLHPDWGKNEEDATYQRGARTGWDEDAALFERRRALWQR